VGLDPDFHDAADVDMAWRRMNTIILYQTGNVLLASVKMPKPDEALEGISLKYKYWYQEHMSQINNIQYNMS
jgi:hypothetical protein